MYTHTHTHVYTYNMIKSWSAMGDAALRTTGWSIYCPAGGWPSRSAARGRRTTPPQSRRGAPARRHQLISLRSVHELGIWISEGSTQADAQASGVGMPRSTGDLPESPDEIPRSKGG